LQKVYVYLSEKSLENDLFEFVWIFVCKEYAYRHVGRTVLNPLAPDDLLLYA